MNGQSDKKPHTPWLHLSGPHARANILKLKPSVLSETVSKTGFHNQWSYMAAAPNPVCLNTNKPSSMSKHSLLIQILAVEINGSNTWCESYTAVLSLDIWVSLTNLNFQKSQRVVNNNYMRKIGQTYRTLDLNTAEIPVFIGDKRWRICPKSHSCVSRQNESQNSSFQVLCPFHTFSVQTAGYSGSLLTTGPESQDQLFHSGSSFII